MPNLDGTGSQGRGPGAGRGIGRATGRGIGRGVGAGVGTGNRPLGSSICTCPKCGHEMSHVRGIPCTQVKCPKCQTLMQGVNCA